MFIVSPYTPNYGENAQFTVLQDQLCGGNCTGLKSSSRAAFCFGNGVRRYQIASGFIANPTVSVRGFTD